VSRRLTRRRNSGPPDPRTGSQPPPQAGQAAIIRATVNDGGVPDSAGGADFHGPGTRSETEIGTALAAPSPSYHDKSLTALGKPVAAVLTAAAAIEAASTRDTASRYVRKQQDAVTALEISALRAEKRPRDRMRGGAGFGDLAAAP
jgi:hypothetical protein